MERPTMRTNSKRYNLSTQAFLTAFHYARQYPEWIEEREKIMKSGKSISSYDGMPHSGTNKISRPTEDKALRLEEINEKICKVEKACMEADKGIAPYLLLHITREGYSFNYLYTEKSLPCSRREFYALRLKTYYILAQKI